MAHPANTGWQGGAPVLMDHEYDGYKALPLGKISSTSFSFEEAPAEEWSITNIHTAPITYSFKAESQEAVNSCYIKPAKGTIEVGQTVRGIVSAKKAVELSQQWVMKLVFNEAKREQEIEIVINRSKRDIIREKSSKLGSSTTPVTSSPVGSDKTAVTEKPPITSPNSSSGTKPSSERSTDKTLDFTYVVMFAATLSLIYFIQEFVYVPVSVVALISFLLGGMTYAYTGPFKEWLNTFATKSKVKKA